VNVRVAAAVTERRGELTQVVAVHRSDAEPRRHVSGGSGERGQRATYVRRGGVGYFFGAYDVHADALFGSYRLANTTSEVLAFYQQSRPSITSDH